MENNRRSFFKGLAAFAGGVVAAKVTSYIPKKEEPKEELMVTSAITIKHGDEEYHPLVVKKTEVDGMVFEGSKNPFSIIEQQPENSFTIRESIPKIRKANI
jgi:hypothetical protein